MSSSFAVVQTSEVIQYFLVKDQKKVPVRRAGNTDTSPVAA